MPELPEVETIRRSLMPLVVGRKIIGLRLTDFPGVLGEIDPLVVTASLTNRTIVGVTRRAKYLRFVLDDETALVVHLRMTGALTVVDRHVPSLRFERLAIELDDDRELRFTDQRKFGRVLHMMPETWAQLDARLGPEPLDPSFTAAEFAHRLSRRTGSLKGALLDQQVVAGLGNIYVDEALYLAGLHPLRVPNRLSQSEYQRLHQAIRSVLAAAIGNRGTTLSSYRDAAGDEGNNQHFLKVYGRGGKNEVCERCGSTIQRIVIAGRSSHFCPTCQPASPAR